MAEKQSKELHLRPFLAPTSQFSIFTLKDVDEIVFEAYLVAY